MDLNQSTMPTAVPGSYLDESAGGSWDWINNSLSKALDAYVTLDLAHTQAGQAQPAPAGYFRVPGTNQVQPAGQIVPGAGGITPGMILMGVGALLLVVLLVKKA